MKKIRILFTINNLDTAGMKYVLADIATSLPKEKYEVAIAVNYLTHSALEDELQKQYKIFKLGLRTSRRPKLLYPLRILINGLKLRGKFDIAHSFDYAADYSEGYIMKVAKIKWIAEKTNLVYDAAKWDRKLNLANKIICLSSAQKIQIDKFKAKVEIIPTGIDESRFENATASSRESLGLTKDYIIGISVAHLIDVKGHMEMMKAMISLKEKYPLFVFIFVGKGEKEYEQQLKQFSKVNNLENNVIFLGERSDIPELIKMSDFKLLATRNTGRREGFGAVVVEAMACSKPVISTRSGGPEDIVIDKHTGYLISAEGYTPIIEGVNKLLNNSLNIEKMGKAGYLRYKANYTKSLMVERYRNVYESV